MSENNDLGVGPSFVLIWNASFVSQFICTHFSNIAIVETSDKWIENILFHFFLDKKDATDMAKHSGKVPITWGMFVIWFFKTLTFTNTFFFFFTVKYYKGLFFHGRDHYIICTDVLLLGASDYSLLHY